jgi:predicted ester cyclase
MMSAEANKMIARRFFDEAWNQNKVSDLDEYVSLDNVHIGDENKARPFGPEQIRELIRTWRTGLPDFQYHIQQLISETLLS